VGIVVVAFVGLILLGGILSALEEPTDEIAASLTDMPSVATLATPTATIAKPSVERVALPRVVGVGLENAKDLLMETDLRLASLHRDGKPLTLDGRAVVGDLRLRYVHDSHGRLLSSSCVQASGGPWASWEACVPLGDLAGSR
jgi:hypothetical protein